MRNALNCPGRLARVILAALVLALVCVSLAGGSAEAESGGESIVADPVSPLHLVYSVHVHGTRDYMPFEDETMSRIDLAEAAGLKRQVMAIAITLEKHGARGSFQFVYGSAAGLCRFDPNFMDRLLAGGHEIGVHAHDNDDVERAVAALTMEPPEGCGMEPPVTGSGVMVMANTNPSPGPGGNVVTPESMSESMGVMTSNGIQQILANIADACGAPEGIPEGTGNIVHPWSSAYGDTRPCESDPNGDLVVVDHVSISELATGGGGPADVLGRREFDHLHDLFQVAHSYVTDEQPSAVAAWGFVTHTHEYAVGNDIKTRPERSALFALDRFLASLDPHVQAGTAVWSTAAEVADLVRQS